MAKLGINTTPPLGTPLPDGGGFINSNFDELYTLLGDGNELYPGIVTSITAGSNISISTNYGNVTIDVSNSAFTETLDTVTDRGNVTTNGIRVGVATASAFVKTGGTSNQFLKADGSVDSNTYLTSASSINLDLDDVTSNGNATANNIQVGSLVALGNVAAGASILAVNAAYASSFRRIGGSADEFLKGDGSVDTLTNVGIGTSSGEESLIVGGDVRILGILTVGSASITIDGDAEMISVGSTVSIGNSGITVGSGVTINDEGVFIQGQPVIDRWMIEGAGISTTANVGIGTIADAARQLKVDGTTELYNLRVAKEGAGIRLDQTGGIDNDGDNFHIWATQNLFLEAGGAGTGTGRGIRILNDTDTVFVDHDLTVDHDIVVGGGVSAVGVVTGTYFEGDGSRLTNVAGAGDTTGLASIVYVDEQVLGVSTVTDALVELSGVPSGSVGLGTFTQDIISDNVGIKSAFQELETSISKLQSSTTANNYLWSNINDDTIGSQFVTTNASNWADATVVYIHRKARHNVDMKNALENMFILGAKMFIQRPDVGGKFFTAYVSGAPTITGSGTDQVYAYPVSNVTTEDQITTQGMRINIGVFVDTNKYQVGLATAGLASIAYVDQQIGLSTAGISTEGLASVAYVDQEIANIGTADTAGLASIIYVDEQVLGVSTVTDALVELSGVPAGSVGLGTFENGIIEDNVGIKSALQDLEVVLAETSNAAKVNNYRWSNNNDNSIGAAEITTDAADWANATKIYVHRKAKNDVDMQNVFNNILLRGAKVFIQKTSDASKSFIANIDSDSPIVTGSGTNEVYEYSVINVSTNGTVFSDGIMVNFGVYSDTNSYRVVTAIGIATAGLASTEYVNNLVAISTAGLGTGGGVSQQYVDNAVGLSTAGLASEDYVDTTEQDIINQVGSLLTVSYYTKTEVDNKVGLATAGISTSGLASIAYVDNASTTTWTLGANGISDYTFTGIGFTQTTNDPDLYLARGQVYNFSNEMGAHPFQIQDTQNGTVGTPYNNGVTNNGASNGTVRFEVPFNAPDTLYYQCTAHTGMGGTIFIYPTLR